jgi:hypothetical protein
MFQHSSIVAFIVHMHAHEWLREADRRRLVESALQVHPFSQGPHEVRSELQQISAEVSVCVVRSSQAAPLERWDETVGDLDDVLTGQACHPWTGDEEPVPPNFVHDLSHARRHLVRCADELDRPVDPF